jgi:hypothetical protein
VIDAEKVIKGLEICKNHDGSNCLECPYFVDECVDDLSADALELLKEQEDKIRQLRLALKIMKGNGVKVNTKGRWSWNDGY